jgi:hypothetical protein
VGTFVRAGYATAIRSGLVGEKLSRLADTFVQYLEHLKLKRVSLPMTLRAREGNWPIRAGTSDIETFMIRH